MKRIVFVAPFFFDATLRFVQSVVNLPNTRVCLISQDQLEHVPPSIRQRLAGHWQVGNAMDPDQLAHAAGKLGAQMGGIDRLLGTLEHIQIQLGAVRDKLGIYGMGEQAARNFRDKARMKTLLRQAGLPCARHREVTDPSDAWAFAQQNGFPLVIKPREGAASVSTYRVRNAQELTQALATVQPAPHNPAVVEEFITGAERSFETACIRGVPVWHSITHYAPPPLTVLENPWIQWTVLLPREVDTPEMAAVGAAGKKALEVLGMWTGLSHMEWFQRSDGSVAISEIAARPPGAQILALNSYAYDVDFYRIWAQLVVDERWEPLERKYSAGVAFFRGQGDGRVVAIEGLEQGQKEVGHLVVEAKLPHIGQMHAPGYEGEGFAIVRHPDTEVVEKAINRLISLVQVKLGG
jgi:hypothetical protein